MQNGSRFPLGALEWLTPHGVESVLIIGRPTAVLAAEFHRRRLRMTVVDPTREGVAALVKRAPQALPVVGAAEALPFQPCVFDAVAIAQGFHRFEAKRALTEFARVLRPGGRLLATYTVRDDSIPWVRRLATMLQQVSPEAMRGDYGTEALGALAHSPYFDRIEHRSFRLWSQIGRNVLLDMVNQAISGVDVPEGKRGRLLDEVAALYDDAAKPPEPLRLPYQVQCWRATVDHTDLSAPLVLDTAMHINL